MSHDIARAGLDRRRIIAAAAAAPFALALAAHQAAVAQAAPLAAGSSGPATTPATTPGGTIPAGYGKVDPRTARRVPLWHELNAANPLFPGDPEFSYDIFATIADDGYLLEEITSLGTHLGTHVDAPGHFVEGAKLLSRLDEGWTLMPLAVVDVAKRVRTSGGEFSIGVADLKAWEMKHGRFPVQGCVLLHTGFGQRYFSPAYSADSAPGLTGEATAWLFDNRGIRAVGADYFGPDATADTDYSATATALAKGGVCLANVGAGLARMRPYGDWINVNAPRPAFSGFPAGITGFTL